MAELISSLVVATTRQFSLITNYGHLIAVKPLYTSCRTEENVFLLVLFGILNNFIDSIRLW